MRKSLVPVIVVIALVASACSGGGGTVATVEGRAITLDDVESLFSEPGGAVPRESFDGALQWLIVTELLFASAEEDFGVTIDEAVLAEALAAEEAVLAAQGDPAEVLAQQNMTLATIERNLMVDQVLPPATAGAANSGVAPTDAEAYAYLAQQTTVCARHILLATEEEALAVKERLDGGEDFAAVAAEVSADPGSGANGGDLGCNAAGGYVPPFAQATLELGTGVLSDPVPSEYGFHLIIVDSRQGPTLTEVAGQLAVELWFTAKMADAEIEIEPEYGTWDAQLGAVVSSDS